MPRPVPTPVMHFTHVDNLPTIIADGLCADTSVCTSDVSTVDVGMPSIKTSRRSREVPVAPGGVVADYAPFYFAPRSPMMSSISYGNVPHYDQGCGPLVYLVTSVERLMSSGLDVVATDRNAALAFAAYERTDAPWGEMIDWDLMVAKWWNNTPEEPDRRERRMAECLVHSTVPWAAFDQVVTMTDQVARAARGALQAAGQSTPVTVVPHWYI